MARRTVYLTDVTEQLVAEVWGSPSSYSALVNDALLALAQSTSPRKVKRVAGRLARQRGQELKSALVPAEAATSPEP